jgi:hypothetical protein
LILQRGNRKIGCMAETRRTSMPQFTLRGILIAITALAVVAFFVAQGQRGRAWGAGLSIGMLAAFVTFGMFAIIFLIASAVAKSLARRSGKAEAKSAASSVAVNNQALKAILIAVTLGAGLSAPLAWAASGGVVVLPIPASGGPVPPTANKTGLTISIDTTWIDSSGYRPVRITATSTTGPAAADRVLTLRFHLKSGYSTRDSVVVSETLEIPIGGTSAAVTMSVPQLAPSGSFEFDVFEDGQYLKELSIPSRTGWTSWSGTFQGDSASPVILLLSGMNSLKTSILSNARNGTPPEVLNVGTPGVGSVLQSMATAAGFNPGAAPGTGANIASYAQLPTRWIDYTGFDIAIVSLSDLKTLIEQNPQQWSAIRDWQRSGGSLLVYGLGPKWKQLPDMEKLLGLSANKTENIDVEKDSVESWQLPLMRNKAPIRMTADLPSATAVLPMDLPDGDQAASPTTTVVDDRTVPKDEAPFLIRNSGRGAIVAVQDADYFSRADSDWTWLLNSLGPQRWAWFERYGVSFSRPNDSFWNFLIPGIGLAPVTAFQVLITVFVISIGPINYWLLKRRGKLNLLILTVPISALVITGALICYALASDGLSTRVRIRSFTQVDQTAGEAICWARLSFYAGLAPGDGLVFDADTAVIPLEFAPQEEDGVATRDLTWARRNPVDPKSPMLQKLTDGWLVSRTPTQFVTSRVRKSKARLTVSSARGAIELKNQLGATLRQLVVADENGKLFVGRDLADGSSVKLDGTDTEVNKVTREMLYTLVENAPQMPDVMAGRSNRTYFGLNRSNRNRSRFAYTTSLGPEPAANQSTSILEHSINAVRDQLQKGDSPPRTYIAISDLGPEVQLGTTATEEASLHIIFGNW